LTHSDETRSVITEGERPLVSKLVSETIRLYRTSFDYLRLGFVRTIPAINFSVIDKFDWNFPETIGALEPIST
jgi:hypothetical protein